MSFPPVPPAEFERAASTFEIPGMIHLLCPHCRCKLAVKEAMAGRLGACPKCKNKIRIPQLETITSEEVPEERVSAAPQRIVTVQPTRTSRDLEDAEDDDRPARPRRRRFEDADDRADDDEPAPRRPRKRRKRRRREASSSFSIGDITPIWFVLIGLVVIWIICFGLSFVFPLVALVPLGLGWLLSIAGGIWFLIVAFQDDVLAGVLCMFVPFYSLYYLITHFDETKAPFFTQLLGTLMMFTSMCGGGMSGAIHGNRPPSGVNGAVCVPTRVIA
jgi:hypothetical protein